MKNNLPDSYIPRSPHKVGLWLNNMSNLSMCEKARLLYLGITDHNLSNVTPSIRVDVAILLRPEVENVLNHLSQMLKERAIPLSQYEQNVYGLGQSILMEYVAMFQIALVEMLVIKFKADEIFHQAIYYTMFYLYRSMLLSYQIYEEVRDTLWKDIHDLFLLASENKLESTELSVDGNKLTVCNLYKEINLLALSNPYHLNQEEVESLKQLFGTVKNYVSLETTADNIDAEFVNAVYMNNDEGAVQVPIGDVLCSPMVRVLDTHPMQKLLSQSISDRTVNYAHLLPKLKLRTDLVERLLSQLCKTTLRRYPRYKTDEIALVVTQQNDVMKIVRRNNISLTHDMTLEIKPKDITNYPSIDSQQKKETCIQVWQVKNRSQNGYGLFLPCDIQSSVRVNDLFAIKVGKTTEWSIGIVRWLKYAKNTGINLGLELLW